MKGDVTVTAAPATQVTFKNCASFTKCITNIDETTIDDVEDLELVMPMYNFIEYSSNYSETTENLWFYSNDEATNFDVDIAINNNLKSFENKAKLLEIAVVQATPNEANEILKNTTIAVPLKYLNNFWRSLEMPLIHCKVEIKLKWRKNCVLSTAANDNDSNGKNIIFAIKDTKLYVPVVTFSVKDLKNKFIGMNIKQE